MAAPSIISIRTSAKICPDSLPLKQFNIFFAFNAIFPISLMPGWLKTIAFLNPLSYVVDAMRGLLVTGDLSHLLLDLFAIVLATALLVSLASLSFKRIIS